MTGVVPINPKKQFFDSAGDPLVGGTVTVYLAGTTTEATTYQDKTLLTANTNPITLNARGECTIWADSGNNYKFVVKDSAGATIYTEDNVPGSADAGAAAAAAAAAVTAALQTPLDYSGVVFGWNQDAGLDSARFIAGAKVGPGKIWASYSPRHSSVNDGEVAMRLDVVELTYDDTAETVTAGTPTTIATPADFATGGGAVWSCGFHVMQGGSNAGRKIIVAQELNTPDGTYTHADSRYDLVLYYSDSAAVSGTWTRVLLLAGQDAHTTFGLADYNAAAAGLHVPSGNCIVEMPNGRLVIVGYLPAAANDYLASMYTDDATGIAGWTAGTPLLYNSANDNEPSVCLTDTGLAAFVRNEAVNSRSVYTSTNGATWTYSRSATDVPIRNVASCALQTSDGHVLVGGPTTTGTTGTDNRTGWKLYSSENNGATFGAGVAMFEENQRIGYSCLIEPTDNTYILLFEVTSDHGGSFNQKGSLGFLRFNKATLEGMLPYNAPLHDGLRFTAADEYDAYAAYVAADSGTMQDSAAALAAITAAINGNYYSKIGLALSGRWGHKGLGTATPKLYSLNRVVNSSASLPGGNITLDTGTYAYAVVVFPGGSSKLTFANTVLHGGSSFGMVAKNRAAGGSIGFMWTNTVAHNVNTAGQATFNGATPFITGSPLYGVAATEVAHFHFNMAARMAMAGKDGIDLQSVTYFPKYSTNGQSVSFDLTATGGANQHMAEAWHLNGVGLTTAMVRQCSTDVDVRT